MGLRSWFRAYIYTGTGLNRRRARMATAAWALSALLWFMMMLNREHEAWLSFPIKITKVPEDIQVQRDVTQRVAVYTRSNGIALMARLMHLVEDSLSLSFQRQRGEIGAGYIYPNELLYDVQRQLPLHIQPLRILPERISIAYERRISKRVPLRSRVLLNLSPAYQLLTAPSFMPESVQIIGPQTRLASIDSWYASDTFEEQMASPQTLKVHPDSVAGLLVLPRTSMMYIVPVLHTQRVLLLPIRVRNVPPNVRVRFSHRELAVSCILPALKYEALSRRTFEISLDYEQLRKHHGSIIPDLSGLPNYVKVVSREPFELEYTLLISE